MEQQRIGRFEELLGAEIVDLKALRALSWGGIPPHCRATAWPLLLGYKPPNRAFQGNLLGSLLGAF